jgi:acetyl-CoA acetyltransferase
MPGCAGYRSERGGGHHRGHGDAGHDVSLDGLPGAGQDRNAKGAWGFDVSAGCSGFMFALQAGAKLVESGAHAKVLVCGADANTRMTDYTDRATCVLFGDGGGAVLLEPAEDGEIGFHRLHQRN